MLNKDLTVKDTGSMMSRPLGSSRFNDIADFFDSMWKHWDLDTKIFTDLQPKSSFPKLNVAETEEAYEVDIALAGFDKEDIGIEFKDDTMYIKADKKETVEDSDKKYLVREISTRSFRRSLSFPKKIDLDGIDCTHKDGIVKCTLKKVPPVKPEDSTVKIDIK